MLRYRIIQKYGDLYHFQVACFLPIWFTILIRSNRKQAIASFNNDINSFKKTLKWRITKQNILRWLLQKENVILKG